MTKVQIRFRLQQPLNDALMNRIADAHSVYGILRIEVRPESSELMLEYDATRLRPAEVESALCERGIPVVRKEN